MKAFKKEIKKRILILSLYTAVFIIAVAIAFIIGGFGKGETGMARDMAGLAGFLIGAAGIAAYRIYSYREALKSGEALEALHIKETDERNRIISLKTCRSCVYSGMGLLGIAGVITYFINRTVFLTIGTILIVLIVLYGVLMLYYSKKY